MKLIDLLAVISENANVIVDDYIARELARYDGRNSIPTELNHTRVMNVYSRFDGTETWIYITVED